MKVIIQRCLEANCKVDGKIVGEIDKGYVLLAGFSNEDNLEDLKKVAKKIVNLRIFSDENDKLNLDIKDIKGEILSVSQFTLYAKLDGRRPSFSNAMKYDEANKMYNLFNEELRSYGINVKEGVFGADMKVSLINDGPVTIIIDSKEAL